MTKVGTIYMLTNNENGKQYIGQTINLGMRIKGHKVDNRQIVDQEIDKYGWDNFSVEVLEANVPEDELDIKEVKYIEKYNTYRGKGYNYTVGGKALRGKEHPFYGKERTEEVKQKISESLSGKKHPRYGMKHTEETRQKISETHAGENHHMYGKETPKETRQKISKSMSGKNNPRSKVSREEGRQIKREYDNNNNLFLKDLADKHDISLATVGRIVNKNHWTTKAMEDSQ